MSRKEPQVYAIPTPEYAQKEALRFLKWLWIGSEQEISLGLVLGRLRVLNPFLFEAILLEVCKKYGYRIQSELKFKKDGGIDGKFSYKGRFYVIQAKLYGDLANPEHIAMFQKAIEWEQAARGFFFHTGKASATFWESVKAADKVQVISGQKLLDFLLGNNCLFERQKHE